VIFALERIPDGGCILADEVGLGKPIEAGLVIAQLRAEGAKRVLVVTPKALLGQWKQELYALFGIDAREVTRNATSFAGEGVLLTTRDLIGSEAGAAALIASERFDLCVVDEAHEVFASIYKRFDPWRLDARGLAICTDCWSALDGNRRNPDAAPHLHRAVGIKADDAAGRDVPRDHRARGRGQRGDPVSPDDHGAERPASVIPASRPVPVTWRYLRSRQMSCTFSCSAPGQESWSPSVRHQTTG
jgi:hypothetical protein